MNKQETLNYVYKRLVEQGGQSRDASGCKYRSETGRKCAAGWLIPDNKYDPDIEGMTVETPEVSDILKEEGYDDIEFVYTLQIIHDDYYPNKGTWKEYLDNRFTALAHRHSLDFQV